MNHNAKACKAGQGGQVNDMTGHCHVCGRETWHKCRTIGCGKLICQLDSISYEEEDDEMKRHCKHHRAEASESSQGRYGSQESSGSQRSQRNQGIVESQGSQGSQRSQGSQGSQGSSYSGVMGEQPVLEDSNPVLPIGGRVMNLLETMIVENGGIEKFDKITTWDEIESVRKLVKRKKHYDSDIVGGWVQRKFVCHGKPSAGGSCSATKLVGFVRGNIAHKQFRTIKYAEKHSCEDILMKVVDPPARAERVGEKGVSGQGASQIGTVKKNVSGPRFECTFCDKSYLQKYNLNTHIWKKHQESSEDDDTSSVMEGLPSSPLPMPDEDENYEDEWDKNEQEMDNLDKEEGYDDHVIEMSEEGLEEELRRMKKKNDVDIVFELRDDDGVIVGKSTAYFHGVASAVVKNMVSHRDFNERVKSKDADKDLWQLRLKRDKLFEQVLVRSDQRNAVHKHMDSASECEQSCVRLQRRLRMHRQQVLLGLEGIAVKKFSKKNLVGFVLNHLRMLKINDIKHTEFHRYLNRNYSGDMKDVVAGLMREIRDRSRDEVDDVARGSGSNVPKQRKKTEAFEISTNRLEKAEEKLKRKEERKKQRDEQNEREGNGGPHKYFEM